ncbi:Uncharacterised protein [Legionella busanensis]|uniref:Uncharacterized protein n=1 Tax=Legionella busanensis TaxID=190655 RepID=A0A378JR78_9GAMM|nr:hypothetical protein [Legionella busanensis]STX52400.1 Uncharacterised protein [Legionella busanensis]
MNLTKIILFLILVSLSFATAAADDFVATTVMIIKKCYDAGNKTDGVALANCVSKQIEKTPNPDNYIVNLEGKVPHQLNLYLYNPKGFKITCLLTGYATIEIKSCSSAPAKPLNSEQQLTISPP